MSYYRGDYYRGDYYRGSIFSTIGGVLKGAAIGFTKGGLLGAVAGARAGLPMPKPKPSPATLPGPAPIFRPQIAPIVTRGPTGVIGGSSTTGVTIAQLPSGQHVLLGGRRRRMNVTNVRALRRAGRRVKGFLKLASRLGALPVNRGKGKTLFKRKRKK